MMDLDHDLAAIVEHAPDPPPFARVQARRRTRRWRRAGIAAFVVLVPVMAGVALLTLPRTGTSTVSTNPSVHPSSTVVTSLYGTTIKVDANGFALDSPRFDATVQADRAPFAGPPSVVLSKGPPPAIPRGAATYVTGDGHELSSVHTEAGGDQLVGTRDGWSIAVTVDGIPPAGRARLASLLSFRDRGRFLVLDPIAPLHLTPSIGTEIVFSGIEIDASSYPSGCPTSTESSGRTGSGFPVQRIGTIAIWCDTTQRVRIQVQAPAPVDAMIANLRVTRIG